MLLTIFAKNRKTKEGRDFKTYSTKMVRKSTGEEVYFDVKFRQECGEPKDFPINIDVEKENINATSKTEIVDENVYTHNILWVKSWKESSDKYRDTSMDDFE